MVNGLILIWWCLSCVVFLRMATAAPEGQLVLARTAQGVAVEWVDPGGPAWLAGVRPGQHVVALDGRAPSPALAGRMVTWHRLTVQGERGARLMVRPSGPLGSPPTGPVLLVTPWVALLGLLVLLRSADAQLGGMVYRLFVMGSAAAMSWPPTVSGSPLAASLVTLGVTIFGWCYCRLFVRLCRPDLARRTDLLLALPMAAAVCARVAEVMRPDLYSLTDVVIGCAFVLYMVVGMATLIMGAIRAQGDARPIMRTMAAGNIAALAPITLLSGVPGILGVPPILPPSAGALFIAAIPITFTQALLRQSLLGLERVVYRWLARLLLAAFLIAVAALVVAGPAETAGVPLIVALLLLLVGAALPLAYSRIWPVGEQWLFGDRYDYRRALRHLSEYIALGPDLATVRQTLPGRLRDLMNLRSVALVLATEEEQAPLPSASAVPLRLAEERLGTLYLGAKANGEPFSREDRDLLATLAGHLATLIHNSQLQDRLAEQVAVLQSKETVLRALNASLQRANEEARTSVAKAIHDGPLQIVLHLQGRHKQQGLCPDTRALWDRVEHDLRSVSLSLRPSRLQSLGLHAALDDTAALTMQRAGVRMHVDSDLEDGDDEVSAATAEALYYIAREAVTNALRHASPGLITVSLRRQGAVVELEVSDDGRGWTGPMDSALLVAAGHVGMASMRERAEQAGGQVLIVTAPGMGTTVRASVAAAPRAGERERR